VSELLHKRECHNRRFVSSSGEIVQHYLNYCLWDEINTFLRVLPLLVISSLKCLSWLYCHGPVNRIPKYTVADVAADLYDLRSDIAHGRSIKRRFLEETGLLDTNGSRISDVFRPYRYRHVLEECSAFLLCQALRKVLTTDLLNDIATERKWRDRLKRPV